MFDGQRSQMGIADEICSDAGQGEKQSEGLGMLLGRLWNPDRHASNHPVTWPQASSVSSSRASASNRFSESGDWDTDPLPVPVDFG